MPQGGTYPRRNAVINAQFLASDTKGWSKGAVGPILSVTTLRGRRGIPSARLGEDGGQMIDFANINNPKTSSNFIIFPSLI
jgi:hypothetical protein